MNISEIAKCINILAAFCGKRDMNELSQESLQERFGIRQADVIILFGGSIPEGCDAAGKAFLGNIAKHFMIVGGEGHTTESLRQKIKEAYPQIETAGKAEADVMYAYMQQKYGIKECLLERYSTNCGNNVTYALELLQEQGLEHKSIIIMQDATMQRRMQAGFDKYSPDVTIINYAAYNAQVSVKGDKLAIAQDDIWGMWDVEQYITLLMGEIPRLTDDVNGYGPNGADYIAHVEVPMEVTEAFQYLKQEYGDYVRMANPLYASK